MRVRMRAATSLLCFRVDDDGSTCIPGDANVELKHRDAVAVKPFSVGGLVGCGVEEYSFSCRRGSSTVHVRQLCASRIQDYQIGDILTREIGKASAAASADTAPGK